MLATKIKNRFTLNKCYETCNELVMSKFVECVVNNNYSVLRKFGFPSKNDLQKAWDKIFQEYLSISGDTQISAVLSLLKQIAIISNRLTLIETIVAQIALKHHSGLAEQLRNMGFRFQYEDGPDLMRELELTINQSKNQLLRLRQAEQELSDLRKNEGKPATEQDYSEQLSALGKFQSYRLDANVITVSEYCSILKQYKAFYAPKNKS